MNTTAYRIKLSNKIFAANLTKEQAADLLMDLSDLSARAAKVERADINTGKWTALNILWTGARVILSEKGAN